MKFIPNYRVKYNGQFYEAGEAVEIDAKDAEEMAQHGKVVEDSTPPSTTRRGGRRRGQSGTAESQDGGG